MNDRSSLALLLLLAGLSLGCDTDSPGDLDAGMDAAAPRIDAGGDGTDAGADAGADLDAGDSADAGGDPDAASPSDAGTDAASPSDAGTDAGACSVDCDCPQGELCASGVCRGGIVPAYCCDTAGCPAGERCTDGTGAAGRCPDPTTACATMGGMCVVQFSTCPDGFVLDRGVRCGDARSLQCCLPR